MRRLMCRYIAILAILMPFVTGIGFAQGFKLVEKAPDPNGSPRPFRDAQNVPLRTSIYFELETPSKADLHSLAVRLKDAQGNVLKLLCPGERFTESSSGWVRAIRKSVFVYIEPGRQLKPLTRYTVVVSECPAGAITCRDVGVWKFTTESAPSPHPIDFRVNLGNKPVQWHGHFFSGICNVVFCTRAAIYGPTYELMSDAHKRHPNAWRLQRYFWLTGMEHQPSSSSVQSDTLPNIVRERETRRITLMEPVGQNIELRVEDFFGHQQYGIPSNRPVGKDYHPGDEVLISDGIHNARAKVVSADSAYGTVTVNGFVTPPGGWKIAYTGPLPTKENPDAPGLFPPGGCYLIKYNPPGTPCYYWGRLDKEFDLAHRYGWRIVVNFTDAAGDTSRDGQNWTTAKDYAEWHDVVRTIAGHIIDRYGKDSLNFTWSIFNEPDLGKLFWHGTWDELQMFYDYSTDAILRAFEDRGYDSKKVFIGGLELGAVRGTNLQLQAFLTHCSPQAHGPGALPKNAAVADHRLDGKRSRRVEALCHAHGGKGSPCDFISIHSYNRSEMMAAKLIRAKEMALEIDPDYYKYLWIDSHESCPDWFPRADEAAGDAYFGDGYFSSWCADVVHRQLLRAAVDPHFSYGETILTVWPPPDNLGMFNTMTRVLRYKEEDGRTKRVTIPMPIFHVLGLLSDMGNQYWVLPTRIVGGHVVGGFASRDKQGFIRVLLYSHDAQDTQSRSDVSFDVTLDLVGLGWTNPTLVRKFQFDRDHNSPFGLIRNTTGKSNIIGSFSPVEYTEAVVEKLQKTCQSRSTLSTHLPSNGHLQIRLRMEGNSCNFLCIQPHQQRASAIPTDLPPQ